MSLKSFTTARDRLLAAGDADLDGVAVCREIVRALAEVAPFQAAAVMTTDPETHLPAGGVVEGFEASACVPFWDNELLDPDFNKFNDLARRHERVATLFEATDGDLHRSPRHTKLFSAFDAVDELRAVFVSGTICLGIASFVRNDGEPFSRTEIADVGHLVVPATNALRRSFGRNLGPAPGDAPAVLVLGPDDTVMSATVGAEQVLADLRLDVLELEGLPGTIRVAAARARSARTTNTQTTLLRGKSGRWVRIHVAPLEGELAATSVTIDGARSSDLLPILLGSYGLTDRETEIVLALCRGLSTKELAADLGISAHTVRDHLKGIFTKAEVNTRGELVAKLFSSHVLGPFEANVSHA